LASLRTKPNWWVILRYLLHVAAGWYYLGKDDQAKPIIDETRTLLFKGTLKLLEQTKLACAYAQALGQSPVELGLCGIEEMFQKLEGVHDTFTMNLHYSLSQLNLIEAVVLGLLPES